MCLSQFLESINSEKKFLIYSENKEISNLGQTFFKILWDKNIESQLLKHPRKTNQLDSSKTYLKRYFYAYKGYQNRDIGKLFLFQFTNNIWYLNSAFWYSCGLLPFLMTVRETTGHPVKIIITKNTSYCEKGFELCMALLRLIKRWEWFMTSISIVFKLQGVFWGYLKQVVLRRSSEGAHFGLKYNLFCVRWRLANLNCTKTNHLRCPNRRISYLFSEYKSQTQLLYCIGLKMFTLLLYQLTFGFRITDCQCWKGSES